MGDNANTVTFPTDGNIADLRMMADGRSKRALWYSAKVGSVCFCWLRLTGGLWTTLLFRQTGAALWFAILIPGVLIVVVQSSVPNVFPHGAVCIHRDRCLILYSVAGFVWAWRMFAQAQDSQWLGETVALFSLSSPQTQAEDTTRPRRKGAFRALVRKELQSHQISLLIGFGLLVLHLCTLVFRGV